MENNNNNKDNNNSNNNSKNDNNNNKKKKKHSFSIAAQTAVLNRKFHTSHISHHVKNWNQTSLLANVKFTYGQFRLFWGLKSALKFHIFYISNV